jgi:hypothetical protein
VSGLERRIKRLEGERGRTTPCPECGYAPGAPVEYEYEWIYDRSEYEGPEFCGTCGEQLLYIVTWGDEPTGAA